MPVGTQLLLPLTGERSEDVELVEHCLDSFLCVCGGATPLRLLAQNPQL
jgi:hypothetical protein